MPNMIARRFPVILFVMGLFSSVAFAASSSRSLTEAVLGQPLANSKNGRCDPGASGSYDAFPLADPYKIPSLCAKYRTAVDCYLCEHLGQCAGTSE